jgi:methionyl-tRNA formyltransferase
VTPQPEDGITYAEKIAPTDRMLDPARTPAELARVVRALDPHIGARIGELRVLAARPAAGPTAPTPEAAAEAPDSSRAGDPAAAEAPDRPPAPGALAAHHGRLVFGAAGGALELLRVQPPGGRPMEAADYLRGHAV